MSIRVAENLPENLSTEIELGLWLLLIRKSDHRPSTTLSFKPNFIKN